MVTISKSIASKIEQKQGNITEDEVGGIQSVTYMYVVTFDTKIWELCIYGN